MNKVLSTYLKICLFLLPILYLPVSVDMINFGKGWFFLVSAILGLFIWLIASLIKKDEFVIRTNKAWWWMFLLTIWAGIWWWMMLPGARMRSFTGIPGMGMILGITIERYKVAWQGLIIYHATLGSTKGNLNSLFQDRLSHMELLN